MGNLEEIAARAAAFNRRPITLRVAEKFAAGYEEKAVREVLRLTGRSSMTGQLLRKAEERTGKPGLSFPLFDEIVPDFPVFLRASRLRFDFDGVFMQLMNDFLGTPMWDAWQDAASSLPESDDGRRLGLVFSWPLVKGCKHFCVLHNAATPQFAGTRVSRAVGDEVFAIETLPSFLFGLGVLAGAGEDGADGA